MIFEREQLDALAAEHGDSFYLYDLDRFVANYDRFLGAFATIYPNARLAYSYKTNYTPRLCALVNERDGYAEVVSRMEYDLAVRLGVPARRILVNGPYKTVGDLRDALTTGSIVNIDWPYQLGLVEEVARDAAEAILMVGLRVTFPIEGGAPSRFGFAAGEELTEAVARIRRISNARLAGLHCHFLTPDRSPSDYGAIARRMLDLVDRHFAEAPPDFVDLGGGFFSPMPPALQAEFGFTPPSYDDYAEAIAPYFVERFGSGPGPELILEPGIAITADMATYVARVLDVRSLLGRTLALVAGSIYAIKPTLHTRNLPMTVVRSDEPGRRAVRGPLDIVGYTCMEHDVLHHGFAGELAPGDFVAFSNVGAYTTVLKPPFILPCPPILGLTNRQKPPVAVLKREESADDVYATYRF